MSGIIANTSDVSWVAESGDCINRQDAINVAIQAADDWDGGYNPERAEMIERGLKMLPALQAESCEDCINRKEVNVLVDELARAISDERCFMSRGRSTANIMQDILDLPSVTPKAESEDKPKGRWIDIGDEGLVFKCSICGTKKTIESHFCPNCGARMTESGDKE